MGLSDMSESYSQIELLVLDKLSALRKKVRALFGVTVNPEVAFDLRGQDAGQANYPKNKIRFNRDLLEKYTDDFISQTVPHEFAHLVAYTKFGRRIKPHGAEWKSVMVALGVKPVRTHSFEVVPARQLKRFPYKCDCAGSPHELSTIRHNRAQRGRLYICKKCGKALQPELCTA